MKYLILLLCLTIISACSTTKTLKKEFKEYINEAGIYDADFNSFCKKRIKKMKRASQQGVIKSKFIPIYGGKIKQGEVFPTYINELTNVAKKFTDEYVIDRVYAEKHNLVLILTPSDKYPIFFFFVPIKDNPDDRGFCLGEWRLNG